MKIFIAVEEFNPKSGYLEYHLAKEFSKLGHIVYVFSFASDDEVKMEFNEGFHIIYLPSLLNINSYHFMTISSYKFLLNFLNRERPDVVHCQPIDSPLSLLFIFYSNRFNYAIVGPVLTQLNLIFSPWGFFKKLLFSASKIIVTYYAAKKSVYIFAKTVELGKIVSKSYDIPMNKFRVIPLGTDPELYKYNAMAHRSIREKLFFSEENIILVYSGKIDSTKGLDTLIKALSNIVYENNKINLLIIGKGNPVYVDYLKGIIKELRLSRNVTFQGWADRKGLNDFYSASDIAVWPGLSSISIVDAASVSLPLIIAYTPVESFAIDNKNGLAFTLGNTSELQNHLRTLIYNTALRKEMGLRSRELVENKLNWKGIAFQYYLSYKNAVNELNLDNNSCSTKRKFIMHYHTFNRGSAKSPNIK